ncbi:MAG TPA: inositol-3-phosphate synthase [Streptosporangiaceae bacterium]|jgi:myo-inositol-1-phosphate synthase
MTAGRSTGLLLVGANGLTASAVFAGLTAMRRGVVKERFGVTSHPAFSALKLPSAADFVLGGWDFFDRPLYETLKINAHLPDHITRSCEDAQVHLMPAVTSALDHPAPEGAPNVRRPARLDDASRIVADDIRAFRERSGTERVVVVYLGSPSRKPRAGFADQDLSGPADEFPGSVAYALGSVHANADFVDFTPSFTLEYRRLNAVAREWGVQLSGRDGSTGQTMLKVALAELFGRRGLSLSSWYSTNLIGNHDGLVLSEPEYGVAKVADKTEAISLDRAHNAVDIRYLPEWGDRKESWDAAEVRSWLGGEVSVRVNWRGSDSELAAPLVVDLARLLSAGPRRSGFRPELGFFFKRPFEREDTTLSERWYELVRCFGDVERAA